MFIFFKLKGALEVTVLINLIDFYSIDFVVKNDYNQNNELIRITTVKLLFPQLQS